MENRLQKKMENGMTGTVFYHYSGYDVDVVPCPDKLSET